MCIQYILSTCLAHLHESGDDGLDKIGTPLLANHGGGNRLANVHGRGNSWGSNMEKSRAQWGGGQCKRCIKRNVTSRHPSNQRKRQ